MFGLDRIVAEPLREQLADMAHDNALLEAVAVDAEDHVDVLESSEPAPSVPNEIFEDALLPVRHEGRSAIDFRIAPIEEQEQPLRPGRRLAAG